MKEEFGEGHGYLYVVGMRSIRLVGVLWNWDWDWGGGGGGEARGRES